MAKSSNQRVILPDRRFYTPKYTPKRSGRPPAIPTRPATIFLKPSGAVLARVVQQASAHVFPNGMWSVEAQRIGLQNLNDAKATQTLDAKQVPWDFGQPALLDR